MKAMRELSDADLIETMHAAAAGRKVAALKPVAARTGPVGPIGAYERKFKRREAAGRPDALLNWARAYIAKEVEHGAKHFRAAMLVPLIPADLIDITETRMMFWLGVALREVLSPLGWQRMSSGTNLWRRPNETISQTGNNPAEPHRRIRQQK